MISPPSYLALGNIIPLSALTLYIPSDVSSIIVPGSGCPKNVTITLVPTFNVCFLFTRGAFLSTLGFLLDSFT